MIKVKFVESLQAVLDISNVWVGEIETGYDEAFKWFCCPYILPDRK